MTQPESAGPSERESRRVAEEARQAEWQAPSFIRELFLGRLRLDLVLPLSSPPPERPEFLEFLERLRAFLKAEVDPGQIDATGEYPPEVLEGLRRISAFGMKIPKAYGGLGLTNAEYSRAMRLLGDCDGSVAALLSAHQSIGVPQPLKLFGTEEQKKKYLPRCAAGEISAFALTEAGVGSDPAHLSTSAVKTPAGDAWILNGSKLWCTNGTLAKLLVVMAVDPRTKRISAFVVETAWPGVTVEGRCRFMGLRAISNAVLRFQDVRVPAENLIGREGQGLKIALTTLNDGRLAIPSISVGMARSALGIARRWAGERVQWGRPVGKHEAIAHKIADMAAATFAMEAVTDLVTRLSDVGGHDIRLEAAATKEWSTARGWEIIDDLMQIRGGRGYETEHSLRARGEPAIPVERMMRDYRINRIFEGSSEIMHLFMAREAVDRHLQVAGALVDPDRPWARKLAALPRIGAFYAWWYPTRFLGWGHWPRFREFGPLQGQVRFLDRTSRRLARECFYGMAVHQARLQNRQAFLFRLVDVANDLFVMAAAVGRAHASSHSGAPEAAAAVELADLFCRVARRRIGMALRGLWSNEDVPKYRVAQAVLTGRYAWMEDVPVSKAD
jgi:alkylation response protein AidB-like acyl-CoA dehydrogenase